MLPLAEAGNLAQMRDMDVTGAGAESETKKGGDREVATLQLPMQGWVIRP